MREYLAHVAYVDQCAADRTADEMLSVIRSNAAYRACRLGRSFHPQFPIVISSTLREMYASILPGIYRRDQIVLMFGAHSLSAPAANFCQLHRSPELNNKV
jgi:hypothetical protein